jgi:hypothetical protein
VGRIAERLAGFIMRSIATMFVCAGVATFAAALVASSISDGWPVVAAVSSIVLQIGGALAFTGAAGGYIERRDGPLLPNEGMNTDASPLPLDRRLLAMVVVLAVVPIALVLRLWPFLQEWGEVVRAIRSSGVLSGPQDMSGLVIIPLAAVLTPPLFELAALTAFVALPVMLLPLLLFRSPRFSRLYLVSTLLVGALVFCSVRGTSAVSLAADGVREQIIKTSVDAQEAATLNSVVNRYVQAVGSAAPPLLVAWIIYAAWLPMMFWSPRVHATFARSISKPSARASTDESVEAITTPPRFPGFSP